GVSPATRDRRARGASPARRLAGRADCQFPPAEPRRAALARGGYAVALHVAGNAADGSAAVETPAGGKRIDGGRASSISRAASAVGYSVLVSASSLGHGRDNPRSASG